MRLTRSTYPGRVSLFHGLTLIFLVFCYTTLRLATVVKNLLESILFIFIIYILK